MFLYRLLNSVIPRDSTPKHGQADFTGISAPCEEPLAPEIDLYTDKQTANECVTHISEHF